MTTSAQISAVFVSALLFAWPGLLRAGEGAGRDFFADEVWSKAAAKTCLKCHKTGGEAEDSKFLLQDPAMDKVLGEALRHNREQFQKMAAVKESDGQFRILLKSIGQLDHGGEAVLEQNSTRYRILERFVRQQHGESLPPVPAGVATKPFFESVEMLAPAALLRRLTLSLAGRLPRPEEAVAVTKGGSDAMGPMLDALMTEEAFLDRLDRLAEGFNDIFLTPGIDDVAENVLSYEHFEKTRHWTQRWDFSHLTDAKEGERAGWRLTDEYREAIKGEPMAMLKHIVRENRPFTEIITADYIMVTPHSARGYGVYDEVKDKFKDAKNYLEYVPVKLKALKARNKQNDQDSATGFYPHAGLLSTFQYLKRYGSELLVFNRLDYSVNNHAPCSRYMATGHLDSLAYPTFAALVAACRGSECPLAFLTFGNYSSTGNIVPMARVPYLPTLAKIANADCVEGNPRSPYHDDHAMDRIEATLREQHETRLSQARLPRVERAQSMLYAAQVNAKALQRVTPYIAAKQPKERLASQAEVALASFKAGVCVSANLSIGQFDSHANNDRDQMALIPEFLSGIDYLLRRAEELDIREKLVVIIQSEMGRTPNYNTGNGRDHWSIGSAMFLGPKIKGNRVLGATDDGQFLRPIDPKTLALTDDKTKALRVRPEHLHLALRQYAGIEKHAFSEKYPFVITETERLEGF